MLAAKIFMIFFHSLLSTPYSPRRFMIIMLFIRIRNIYFGKNFDYNCMIIILWEQFFVLVQRIKFVKSEMKKMKNVREKK